MVTVREQGERLFTVNTASAQPHSSNYGVHNNSKEYTIYCFLFLEQLIAIKVQTTLILNSTSSSDTVG